MARPRPPLDPSDPAHERFMRVALEEARRAGQAGEVPIGAVLVKGGAVVARAGNGPIGAEDPTAHAEVRALRQAAAAAGNYRLSGVTAYVTIEPCLMCVGALVNARIGTVVYGADEPKWGAVRSLLRVQDLPLNHRLEILRGVLEPECRALIVDFFRSRR